MTRQRPPSPEPIPFQSPSLRDDFVAHLRLLAPQVFVEGSLDFARLRELLAAAPESGSERFSFTWAGRRDAVAMLQVPTRATLVPDVDESIDFARAKHVFVEGDNLETLKVVYRAYYGRVKFIYLDPPYNRGHDLIYRDNFIDPLDHYLRITGQKSGDAYLSSAPEKSGRYHSSWLSMMYPRLVMARQLLTVDGLLCVSISDLEVAPLEIDSQRSVWRREFHCTICLEEP